jgi:hypothetical protein
MNIWIDIFIPSSKELFFHNVQTKNVDVLDKDGKSVLLRDYPNNGHYSFLEEGIYWHSQSTLLLKNFGPDNISVKQVSGDLELTAPRRANIATIDLTTKLQSQYDIGDGKKITNFTMVQEWPSHYLQGPKPGQLLPYIIKFKAGDCKLNVRALNARLSSTGCGTIGGITEYEDIYDTRPTTLIVTNYDTDHLLMMDYPFKLTGK